MDFNCYVRSDGSYCLINLLHCKLKITKTNNEWQKERMNFGIYIPLVKPEVHSLVVARVSFIEL